MWLFNSRIFQDLYERWEDDWTEHMERLVVTTVFISGLTSLFLWQLLHVKPGPPERRKFENWCKIFTGWCPSHHPAQQTVSQHWRKTPSFSRCLLKQRMMEVVSGDNRLDYWSYKSCKAPVKSSPPTNQHTVFLQAGCPSFRPTDSVKALKGKISHFMDLLTPSSPGGLPTLSLTTNSSWLPWGTVAMPLVSPLMPVPQLKGKMENMHII